MIFYVNVCYCCISHLVCLGFFRWVPLGLKKILGETLHRFTRVTLRARLHSATNCALTYLKKNNNNNNNNLKSGLGPHSKLPISISGKMPRSASILNIQIGSGHPLMWPYKLLKKDYTLMLFFVVFKLLEIQHCTFIAGLSSSSK